ncbi:hypothetical protein SAMN05421854_114151 [Amycolatopsis rubida]|uniref:Uncharacterized protein n=1 Tax=Amycolatopsis rubida TaxID=112413 RepID=A0A1I5ZAK3_9PSEU|nr:hypothetical protein SAMN05421854_114151 [Amycolatopsis rubida]
MHRHHSGPASPLIEVRGHRKQGAGFGHSGCRGLNSFIATVLPRVLRPRTGDQARPRTAVDGPRSAAGPGLLAGVVSALAVSAPAGVGTQARAAAADTESGVVEGGGPGASDGGLRGGERDQATADRVFDACSRPRPWGWGSSPARPRGCAGRQARRRVRGRRGGRIRRFRRTAGRTPSPWCPSCGRSCRWAAARFGPAALAHRAGDIRLGDLRIHRSGGAGRVGRRLPVAVAEAARARPRKRRGEASDRQRGTVGGRGRCLAAAGLLPCRVTGRARGARHDPRGDDPGKTYRPKRTQTLLQHILPFTAAIITRTRDPGGAQPLRCRGTSAAAKRAVTRKSPTHRGRVCRCGRTFPTLRHQLHPAEAAEAAAATMRSTLGPGGCLCHRPRRSHRSWNQSLCRTRGAPGLLAQVGIWYVIIERAPVCRTSFRSCNDLRVRLGSCRVWHGRFRRARFATHGAPARRLRQGFGPVKVVVLVPVLQGCPAEGTFEGCDEGAFRGVAELC